MNMKKYINAEWKDIHEDLNYVYAYNSEKIRISSTPTLLVGIGGTGIEAVLEIKNLTERLYHPSQAGKLEYLLIDTDSLSTDANIDKRDTVIVQSADTAMMIRAWKEKPDICPEEIKNWLDETMTPFKIMNGAAGIRQAGRLILFLNAERIYAMIDEKITRISANYDEGKARIRVYIFAGIGGGTGSGMFVDVSYLIRKRCSNADCTGVLFMPDVSCKKPGLKNITKDNIKRNGFAALKELEYLMMLERYSGTFTQKYPGSIGIVSTSAPIFDQCILVGGQEAIRRNIPTEKEILKRVAEYIISELQEKEKNGHNLESFHSNVKPDQAALQSKAPFFENYLAIGAKSIYIPVDYYYSKWLCDVLRKLKDYMEKDGGEFISEKAMKFLKETMTEDINRWYVMRPKDGRKGAEQYFAELFTKESHDILSQNAESHTFFILNRDFTQKMEEVAKSVKKQYAWWKPKEFKRRRMVSVYKDCFAKYYLNVIKELQVNQEELKVILEQLYMKCREYGELKTDAENFLYGELDFGKIRSTQKYKDSLDEAILIVLKDFGEHCEEWMGKKRHESGRVIWLSQYIANLLNDCFQKSECTRLSTLMEYMYDDGVQSQEEHIKEILDTISETDILWPVSGSIPSAGIGYDTVIVPNDPQVYQYAVAWAGNDTSITPTELKERFSKVVLSVGHALHTYSGIDDFERAYDTASNRMGLHLYATKEKNWNEFASPYFESCWNLTDKEHRKIEKERNETYRKCFEEALKKGWICYDENSYLYYLCVDDDEQVVQKTERSRKIYIGDITGKEGDTYKETAKDMFIHMYDYRDKIKNAVETK